MCGRFAGGMATSILFSAFESWVICEHDKVSQQRFRRLSSKSRSSPRNKFSTIASAVIMSSVSTNERIKYKRRLP